MMNFKYLDNHMINSLHSKEEIKCDVCNEMKICHLPANGGLTKKMVPELIEQVCYACIHKGRLVDTDTVLCPIDQMTFFEDLQKMNSDKSYNEILAIKDVLQSEIESKTPQIQTVNEFYWPRLDNDFAKFIGFVSKTFLHDLSNGDGADFYKSYLAPISDEMYSIVEFSELPDQFIIGIEEALKLSPVGHVFKSLSRDNYIIVWSY